MASALGSFNSSNYPEYHCPVNGTPLADAVLLAPCGDSISQVAAETLYPGLNEDSGKEGSCPVCERRVTHWIPNIAIRSTVALVEAFVALANTSGVESAAPPAKRMKENSEFVLPPTLQAARD